MPTRVSRIWNFGGFFGWCFRLPFPFHFSVEFLDDITDIKRLVDIDGVCLCHAACRSKAFVSDLDAFIACHFFTNPSRVYLNDGRGNLQATGQDLGDAKISGAELNLVDLNGDAKLDMMLGDSVGTVLGILPSADYHLEFDHEGPGWSKITVTGHGYGHGVGMCQCGAIGRARAGQSYEEILKAYYTGVKLVTEY